jgi:spore coat polysaccharide biosynthesis protein SpsF (cytidylyltransferase family)
MALIEGEPALAWICARAARARGVDGVVVATSSEDSDETIRAWAREAGVACVGGSLQDVLGRTIDAARAVAAQRIVFINGDSPLTDPLVIEQLLRRHDQDDVDYVSSLHGGGGFPDGYSVEAFTLEALERAAAGEDTERAREHTTTVFYDVPGRWRVGTIAPPQAPPPGLHLSLDTADDLALIREIHRRLLGQERFFGYAQVIELLAGDAKLLARAQGA